jgi:hypothetical protein
LSVSGDASRRSGLSGFAWSATGIVVAQSTFAAIYINR